MILRFALMDESLNGHGLGFDDEKKCTHKIMSEEEKMSEVDEIKRLENMVEGGLVDKATIVGLFINEFRKEYGDESLKVAGRVQYKRGEALGKRIRKHMEEQGRDINDLSEIRKSHAEVSGSTSKRRDLDVGQNRLEYDVLYCPMVDGFKRAGFSEEEISVFCEVLNESDKALPKAINPRIELTNDMGLARGKSACRVIWEIK